MRLGPQGGRPNAAPESGRSPLWALDGRPCGSGSSPVGFRLHPPCPPGKEEPVYSSAVAAARAAFPEA